MLDRQNTSVSGPVVLCFILQTSDFQCFFITSIEKFWTKICILGMRGIDKIVLHYETSKLEPCLVLQHGSHPIQINISVLGDHMCNT